MDPLQLVLTGTFMEIAYFLFEVPTGVVADSYSRRTSVIVAQVIMGISFVVTGLVTNVPLILAAAALMGFGWTFKSGAIDAWLADEVGQDRLGHEYQRGAQVAESSRSSESALQSRWRSSISACRSSSVGSSLSPSAAFSSSSCQSRGSSLRLRRSSRRSVR